MPPKAPGRGGPARRPPGGTSRDEQAANTENGTSGSPPRPPIQRLQSLNRRAPGGSIAPRGGAGLGQQPKPALKFQPRASARRAKEERDALQELEAERNRARLSEAAAIQRARLGRAARGRGTFRGRGGVHGGGPVGFGAGGKQRRIDITRSASRHSTSGYNTPAAGPSFGDYSSDEDSAVTRLNIEHINLNDDYDSEDEDKKDRKGKKPARAARSGLQPIRVERHHHEERVVAVNTEASSTISAGLRQQVEADEASDNELFITEEPEDKVKPEPTDGDVSMADVPHENDETPLPPQTVTARKQVAVKERVAKERAAKAKGQEPDPQSLLQTKEEKEEFARHADDLETLKEILTPSEKVAKTAETAERTETETEAENADAEAKEANEEEEEHDKNAGRLFLIQFPPLTPNLVVPGIGEHAVVDLEDVSENTTTGEGISLGDAEVKREYDDEDEEDKLRVTSEPPGKLLTATQRRIPAGRVGKLHLHESGRVTLDWGGISFEIDKGASVNFVQEALVASTPADEDEERSVWAMGQLSEKFIASPEWDKLL